MVGTRASLAALLCAAAFSARAQVPVDRPSAMPPISAADGATVSPAATAGAQSPVVPLGSYARIRIETEIGSKLSAIGQTFPIALARPIFVDGIERVPAGARGQGQVVHAAKARAGGKAGELILAARFVEHDGVRVPLRSLKLAGRGADNTDAAFVVGVAAGLFAFAVSGGNFVVPAGSEADAKVAADVVLPFTTPQPTEEKRR